MPMSDTETPTKELYRRLCERFQEDPVSVIEAYFGVRVTDVQRRIIEAIHNHEHVLIVSGNDTGKSYGVSLYGAAFFLFNWKSVVMFTSGNYDVLTDASWRVVKSAHKHAQKNDPFCPGRRLEGPPRIETEYSDEWYMRYLSPTYPDNLEGRHERRSLVVIEEADKPDISHQHFDSAATTASSKHDRLVAVANPPQSKGNVVYDKMNDDRWHKVNFSTFESHNVQVELGNAEPPKIQGIADLELIKDDYEDWNRMDWPGVEAAQKARPNLVPRWYRRRLGIIPPTGPGATRPFYERDVDAACDRYSEKAVAAAPSTRTGLGFDLARGGGDRTAGVEQRGPLLECILEREFAGDHTVNKELMLNVYDEKPLSAHCLIDAVGEGSGPADEVRKLRPRVRRFDSRATARDDTEYDDARSEAICELGMFLRDRGIVQPNSPLEKELRMASRVLESEEKHLRENTVVRVTGKEELKKNAYLGRSPDLMDAAALAVYAKPYADYSSYEPIGGQTA